MNGLQENEREPVTEQQVIKHATYQCPNVSKLLEGERERKRQDKIDHPNEIQQMQQ